MLQTQTLQYFGSNFFGHVKYRKPLKLYVSNVQLLAVESMNPYNKNSMQLDPNWSVFISSLQYVLLIIL